MLTLPGHQMSLPFFCASSYCFCFICLRLVHVYIKVFIRSAVLYILYVGSSCICHAMKPGLTYHSFQKYMHVPSQDHCVGFELSIFYPDIAICYTDFISDVCLDFIKSAILLLFHMILAYHFYLQFKNGYLAYRYIDVMIIHDVAKMISHERYCHVTIVRYYYLYKFEIVYSMSSLSVSVFKYSVLYLKSDMLFFKIHFQFCDRRADILPGEITEFFPV